MNGITSAQFISVSIHLYPRCGYQQLSEKTITEHLNSDMETFNQMFTDRDEFIRAMPIKYSNRTSGRVSLDFVQNMKETERLYQIMWWLAIIIRKHLAWIYRMLLDSTKGVELMTKTLKK